jgi:flagellar biosynthesis/type III secretory pathway chaperone
LTGKHDGPEEQTDSSFFPASFFTVRTGGGILDTGTVKKLIELLDKEAAIYEGLLRLSREKTDIIVQGKVTELEGITKVEQSMILQLAKLEENREKLVEMLSEELGINADDITVTELEKALPKDQSKELAECREKMTGIFRDIKNSNDLNTKLIKSSLDYIDFSVNILSNAGSSGDLYGKSGQSNDPGKRNFFDVKL